MLKSLYNIFYGKNTQNKKNDSTIEFNKLYSWKIECNKYKESKKKSIHNFLSDTSHINNVDLRHKCPIVYNQGKLGSCTANSIAFLYQYCEMKQNNNSLFTPSRLFIYYNERDMEGDINEDNGAEIHDGIHSLNTMGVCDELRWPYDIEKFNIEPTDDCYIYAKNNIAIEYQPVKNDIMEFKKCLINGNPVSFGFIVFDSFESKETARTGIMSIPKSNEKKLGGHAVALVGYNDTKKYFIVRNSWGEEWGDKGYFYMPYDFITNKDWVSDCWIVTKVSKK